MCSSPDAQAISLHVSEPDPSPRCHPPECLTIQRSSISRRSGMGLVSRAWPVQTAMRNCTRDEGGPFEVGNQVLTSSHRKLLSSKAMVVLCQEGARAPCCTRDEGGPFGAVL